MNINDFKNAYDGIHATPELKKRVLEKVGADSEAKRSAKKIRFFGTACGVGAAAVFILGGALLIRWLNIQAEPSIVVTAGSMPKLNDAPVIASSTAAAAQPDVVFYETASGGSYPVDEMPEIDGKYYAEYSFSNAYDERFTDTPDGSENWYECIAENSFSVEKASELLAEKGFNDSEIDAIVTRNKELCKKMFADYGYKCDIGGITAYLTLENLYDYDIMDFYTLYAGGLTDDEMNCAAQRMLDIAGGEDVCNVAMKRKALLYESYVRKMDAMQNGAEFEIESDWAQQYFDERVTKFGSEYEYGGVTIDNLFAKLFTEEQLRKIAETVGSPSLNVIPNYYAAIVRMEIPADEARNALEKMSEMYREKTGYELFTDEEITLITDESQYPYIKHFLDPHAAVSHDNISGESLIVCGSRIVSSGAYDWLLDYRDIEIESVYDEISVSLSLDGNDELTEKFNYQYELYEQICDITENKLGAYIKARDIKLVDESKPALNDETRQLLKKTEVKVGRYYTLSAEDFYETKLNYLARFLMPEQAEELFNEVGELLTDPGQKNWLVKKKYIYFDYCGYYGSDDYALNNNEYPTDSEQENDNYIFFDFSSEKSALYNEEYLSALLDATNYEYKISDGTVYLEPYFSGIVEYLNQWHIRNTDAMENFPENSAQVLYEENVDGYRVTVEAPVGEITQEGYYNTTENTYLCVYGSDGGLISRSSSQNGMSGLDGFLIYVAPGEKYFDVYNAPSGEIIIILRTFYPERYRKEGEAFFLDKTTGKLKRFGTSQDIPAGYDYSSGIFDYGDEGLGSCSETEYINIADGLKIVFDFDDMLIKASENQSKNTFSGRIYNIYYGYKAAVYVYSPDGKPYSAVKKRLELRIIENGEIIASDTVGNERSVERNYDTTSPYYIEAMLLPDQTQLIAVYGIFSEMETTVAELFHFDGRKEKLSRIVGQGYYGISEIAYAPGCLTLKDGTDNVLLNSADGSEITLDYSNWTFTLE